MEDVTPKPPDPGDSTQAAAAEQQDTAVQDFPRRPANFTGQWVHIKNGRIAS